MQFPRGFLSWGVFLIMAGAIPIAARAGYLTEAQLAGLWSLWPLILIGFGIGLILSRTRLDFVGGLVVAATFGIMAGGLLSGGIGSFSLGTCGSGSGVAGFPVQSGAIEGANASVEVQLDCGNVTIATAPGTAWRVAGVDATAAGPDIQASAESLSVRSRDDLREPFGIFGGRAAWAITLPDGPRLDIAVRANAGEAAVDLDGAAIGSFDLELNAVSATVDLGAVREIGTLQVGLNAGSLGLTLPNHSMSGVIGANAGSVRLCAPPGAALKLETGESVVAGYDFEGHGLVHEGSTWITPGFDSAAVQIQLQTAANAGSFVLDPEDGCG